MLEIGTVKRTTGRSGYTRTMELGGVDTPLYVYTRVRQWYRGAWSFNDSHEISMMSDL
jgi:hypothetical protein